MRGEREATMPQAPSHADGPGMPSASCGRCGGDGAAGAAGLCAACDALADAPCIVCGAAGGHEPGCTCSGIRIGRQWVWDEGRGGAYYLEGGLLCWAEFLPVPSGRFDWECGAQVDSRDLLSGDPGWDYARWAEERLRGGCSWAPESVEPHKTPPRPGSCPFCGLVFSHAPGCSRRVDALVAELCTWVDSQGLPQRSADELLLEDVTEAQREWLEDFLGRWDAEVRDVREHHGRKAVR